MTIIQKNILASLQASAKSAMTEDKIKPISIGSLAATIGTSPDQIRQDIKYLCNQGFIDPGEVDVQTAVDLRPGQVVVILQLDPQKTLPFNDKAEVKALKSEAEAPFLTVAQDTYHAVSTPEADGSFTLEIVENQGTKYETVVFRETSVMTFEAVDQLRREWADNRENTLSWEFRADKGKGEVLLAFEVNRIVEDGKESLEIRHYDPITGGYIADPQCFENKEPEEGSQEPVESIWNIWSVFMRREVDLRFPDVKPDVTISAEPDWVDDDGDKIVDALLYPNFAETGGTVDGALLIEGGIYFLNRVGRTQEGQDVAWELARIKDTLEPQANAIYYAEGPYEVAEFKYFALDTWPGHAKLQQWLGDAYEPESTESKYAGFISGRTLEEVAAELTSKLSSLSSFCLYQTSTALRRTFGDFEQESYVEDPESKLSGHLLRLNDGPSILITNFHHEEGDEAAVMLLSAVAVDFDPETNKIEALSATSYHAVNDKSVYGLLAEWSGSPESAINSMAQKFYPEQLEESSPATEELAQELTPPKSKGKKAKDAEEEPAKKEDFDPYDEER